MECWRSDSSSGRSPGPRTLRRSAAPETPLRAGGSEFGPSSPRLLLSPKKEGPAGPFEGRAADVGSQHGPITCDPWMSLVSPILSCLSSTNSGFWDQHLLWVVSTRGAAGSREAERPPRLLN